MSKPITSFYIEFQSAEGYGDGSGSGDNFDIDCLVHSGRTPNTFLV